MPFKRRHRSLLGAALAGLALVVSSSAATAAPQDTGRPVKMTLEQAAAQIDADVVAAEADLAALRAAASKEILPVRARLSELQKEILSLQSELHSATRAANSDALEVTNLTKDIDKYKDQTARLSSLFNEYSRNFEARLHISEIQLYRDAIDRARAASENPNLTQAEIFAAQAEFLNVSLERLFEVGGGRAFDGSAVDQEGLVREGKFALLGPTAIFRSEDGKVVGTAETRIGSISPVITRFYEESDSMAAAEVAQLGSGGYPFDGSGGKAHKIAATKETLVEHIQKGGAIMYPILIMAALALLVAVYKWVGLSIVRKPRKKKLRALLEAVAEGDEESARRRVKEIKGPAGKMLSSGVDTMRRSRDLMEEVMYETVLTTKTKLQAALPFIAICAASAPLLGLLGTVTGIINTFKQITVFGSGDVKSLSGGISEALITTKFGLIVAIPSLLLHAYLSRRARGVVTQMEASAVQFANEVAKSDEFGEAADTRRRGTVPTMMGPEHELVRGQVSEILTDLLGPLSNDVSSPAASRPTVGPNA